MATFVRERKKYELQFTIREQAVLGWDLGDNHLVAAEV